MLETYPNYTPKQISMTYWFVNPPNLPDFLTFPYSREQHAKTREDLGSLLNQLDHWLNNYWQQGINLPAKKPQPSKKDWVRAVSDIA